MKWSIVNGGKFMKPKPPLLVKSLPSIKKWTGDQEKQGSAPWKICEAFKRVSEQFGIRLPDDFVKVPEYEQMKLPVE